MAKDIDLNDIADQLLIVDQRTISHLFELESCADCVALYMFLYKTAKWQGTGSVKANDVYIRKCLGWGSKRVTTTKGILEKAGLIKKVARRKDGKIVGHFIEVAYLLHHNTRKPLVDETTCGFGETNAYKSIDKVSLQKEIIKNDIWKDAIFWEEMIEYSINEEINTNNGFLVFLEENSEENGEKKREERIKNSVNSVLITFSYNMNLFNVPKKERMEIINIFIDKYKILESAFSAIRDKYKIEDYVLIENELEVNEVENDILTESIASNLDIQAIENKNKNEKKS